MAESEFRKIQLEQRKLDAGLDKIAMKRKKQYIEEINPTSIIKFNKKKIKKRITQYSNIKNI